MTTRLVLHPMTIDEAQQVLAQMPDADARWAPGYPADGERNAALRYLTTCEEIGDPRPFGTYEIRRREDGQAIGGLGFHGAADERGVVTIGYGLIPSVRGMGYATEALRELLRFAAAHGVTAVEGDTTHDNLGSQRVMEAVGMRLVEENEKLRFYRWNRNDT
ncbi:hypothetical protein GCM10009765_19880 [Fodinicola feengrottensis]|uniref:N-acetyltransferase domain-containing protein n=1 Tax=Fodinicola feengrottensis TaxID=435914 RepID=A0ABN2GFM2_9ACTN